MTTKDQTIPKGYKHTEVGVIPSGWEVKELVKIANFYDNFRIPVTESKREHGLTPYYGANGIQGYINGHTHDGEFVLIAEDGANDLNNYPVQYVNGKVWVNNHAHVIQGIAGHTETKYLSYALKTVNFVQVLVGGTRAKLNGSVAKAIKILIPIDIAEQATITTALSDADALIEKLVKLIEKKKNIKQGAMQELLTGKRRLPGFSGKWEVKKMGEVANFDHGRDLPKSDLSDEGKYKCIHYGQLFNEYKELISNIKSKTDKSTNTFYSKSNDVLMPTSDVTPRGLATASCIKEDGVILGGGILVVRLYPEYDGVFLSYYITQHKNDVLRFVKGSTVFHLYAGDISNFEIAFPEFGEQTAIATVLSDMDTEIERLESQLSKYRNLKQGMMQTLLTGKIRLI